MRLMFWRRPREQALRAEVKRLAKQLGAANALVNRLEASIDGFGKAVRSYQRNLATEELLTQQLTHERDDARRQVAELASDNVILTDQVRHLEASLSGAREELRQERVARERAEQDAAEHAVTIEGLGLEMARLQQEGA